MANIYLGVSDIARKAKNIYLGVSDTARKVKKIYIGDSNGVARLAYKSGSGVDPTKSSFTEAEFLGVIADGNQSLMTIGALITLSNTYCNTYEVIGVNHDNTTGTVDIMAHTQVGNQAFGSSQIYSSSSIRTWINGTYFNTFSNDIRNASKTMSVATNDSTVNDKVKLLSATEMGISGSNVSFNEGSLYTGVFTPGDRSTNIIDRWRGPDSYGDTYYFWIRSKNNSHANYVWCVYRNGLCIDNNYTDTRGVLPVLRF